MANSAKAFQNIARWLKNAAKKDWTTELRRLGEQGVTALAAATPKDTGDTASQWRYALHSIGEGTASILFCNDHVNNGANIAILLQYGHGTGTGGYVAGIDYINPALRPLAEALGSAIAAELKQGI